MLKSKLRLATVYIKVAQDQTHLALKSRRHHIAPEVGTISRQSLVYKITLEIPSQTLAEVAWTTATFYTIASYNLEKHIRLATTIWPEMYIFYYVTVRKLSARINAIYTDDQDLSKVFHWAHEINHCNRFVIRVANPRRMQLLLTNRMPKLLGQLLDLRPRYRHSPSNTVGRL